MTTAQPTTTMKFIDSTHPQWHHVLGEDGPMPHPDPAPNLLLSLEQWHAVRDHWPAGLPHRRGSAQ